MTVVSFQGKYYYLLNRHWNRRMKMVIGYEIIYSMKQFYCDTLHMTLAPCEPLTAHNHIREVAHRDER